MTTAEDIYCTLEQMGDERLARNLSRFFKTGKGDYGEGDRFLGLKCPQTRMVVHEARLDVSFEEIEKLLYSEWHEVRFAGFRQSVGATYRHGDHMEADASRTNRRHFPAC